MLVEDGKGRGFSAAVDGKNRLEVHAQDDDRTEVVTTGKAWSISFDGTTPTDADDYFLYIANSSTDTYILTDFRIFSTANTVVEVRKVTNITTVGYTSEVPIIPVSRNLGSATTPSGTFSSDANITNLINGGVLFYIKLVAGVYTQMKTSAGILIPPGTSVALLSDTGAGPVIQGTVSLFVIDVVTN